MIWKARKPHAAAGGVLGNRSRLLRFAQAVPVEMTAGRIKMEKLMIRNRRVESRGADGAVHRAERYADKITAEQIENPGLHPNMPWLCFEVAGDR